MPFNNRDLSKDNGIINKEKVSNPEELIDLIPVEITFPFGFANGPAQTLHCK